MDFIQFALPQTLGEGLAWGSALVAFLIGVFIMAVPRPFMAFVGLKAERADGLAEIRGPFGGTFAGFGLACLLLSPQPLLYFALGFAFAFAAIGRVLSFAVERFFSAFSFGALIIEAAAAFFCLSYVFGIIA